MPRKCGLTGKTLQFGNNRSHAENKTRRVFNVNVQRCGLFSEVLGRSVRLRLCMNAMRTVEKTGGIDAFLLAAPDAQLSAQALKVKRMIAKVSERTAKAA